MTGQGDGMRTTMASVDRASNSRRGGIYCNGGKRALDLAVSVLVLLAAVPCFFVVSLAILAEDGWPVFYFTSDRPGRFGVRFQMYKFRTMAKDAEARLAHLIANDPNFAREWHTSYKVRRDPRITRVGRLLRRSSLDELPQLLNIVQGNMSLVGPRPVTSLAELEEKYGAASTIVLDLRPGLTGLWQVSGRSQLPYPERVRLDVAYASRVSLRQDVEILVRTFGAVISGRGAI